MRETGPMERRILDHALGDGYEANVARCQRGLSASHRDEGARFPPRSSRLPRPVRQNPAWCSCRLLTTVALDQTSTRML